MNKFRKLLFDSRGIARVVGVRTMLLWLSAIVWTVASVVRRGDLQPADRAMGEGPFAVHYGAGVNFRIEGAEAFTGIREMYVRDVYLQHGLLRIDPGDVVVDLGANMGNFSNFALAHGASRVVAVEPSPQLNDTMWKSVRLNEGFSERLILIQAFLGSPGSPRQSSDVDPMGAGTPWLSEDELLVAGDMDRIDFLKCDIEGGEFGLLSSRSRVLAMARKLAIEVHSFAGDVDEFIQMLRDAGFAILHEQRDPDGTKTVLAQRT